MENQILYIDAYFNKELNSDEIRQFEAMILEDKDFAEQVAFYMATKEVSKEEAIREKKEWFRQLAAEQSLQDHQPAPVRKLWVYRAAAAVVILVALVGVGYVFFHKPVSSQQLADQYIKQKLVDIGNTMGASDSMEIGRQLYNNSNLDSSLKIFESLIEKDSSNLSAKKYAGIVYLRKGNYDKALHYFQQLEDYQLQSNSAHLYYVLTIMKRNLPGDKQKVKQLLNQIVTNDWYGKETAQEWLKKL